MTKTNEVLLSEKRLSEIGEQLIDILHDIEMQNHVINFIPNVKDAEEELLFNYSYVYKALDTFYESNQRNTKKLDDISFILQNLTNAAELKSLGEKVIKDE